MGSGRGEVAMAMSHAMSSGSDATRHTSTTAYTTKNDKRENKRDDRRKIKTGFSLLSLSDKSAVDVVGDLDVDCATGPFRSSSSCFVRHPAACGGWTLG